MGGGASAHKKGFQGAVAGSFSYDGVVISVNFSEQGLYEDEKVYVLWLNPFCFLVHDDDPWELVLFVYNLQKGALYRVMNKFHRHALLGLYDDSQLFRRGMFVGKQKLPFMKRKTGSFEGLEIGESSSEEPTIDGKTGVVVQWVNPCAFRTQPNGARPPELWVYLRERDAYMVVTQCERPVSDAQTNPKKVRRRKTEEPVAASKSDGEDPSQEKDSRDDNKGTLGGARAEKDGAGEEVEAATARQDTKDPAPPPKDADTSGNDGGGGDHRARDTPCEVPPDPVDQEGADAEDGGGDSAKDSQPSIHPSNHEEGDADGAARPSVSSELSNSGFEAESADALPRVWRPFDVVKGRFLREGCTHSMHVVGRGVKYGGRRADIEWLSPFVFWFEQKSDNGLRMCIYLCEYDSYMVVHDPSCSLANALSIDALWKRTDGSVPPDLLNTPNQAGAFEDLNVSSSGPVLLDGESLEAVWLNPCTFRMVVEGAMQIWTYSMQEKTYLQLGEWESPVWSARNIPERRRHWTEAVGWLKAYAEPMVRQENPHQGGVVEPEHVQDEDGRRVAESLASERREGKEGGTGGSGSRRGVSGGMKEPQGGMSESVQRPIDDDDTGGPVRVNVDVQQQDVSDVVGADSQQDAPRSTGTAPEHNVSDGVGLPVGVDAKPQLDVSDNVQPDQGVSQYVERGEHGPGAP